MAHAALTSVHCSRRPACCPSPAGCQQFACTFGLPVHALSLWASASHCLKRFCCQEDAKPAPAAVAAAAPPAEAPAKAEKPKNPLDALPPSKMVRFTNRLIAQAGPCGPFQRATCGQRPAAVPALKAMCTWKRICCGASSCMSFLNGPSP